MLESVGPLLTTNLLHTPSHTNCPYNAGELVTRQPLIASMREVKKETLKLISSWVSRSSDPVMVRHVCSLLEVCAGALSSNTVIVHVHVRMCVCVHVHTGEETFSSASIGCHTW